MKNSIKKLLILLVFVVLCLGMVACKSKPDADPNAPEQSSGLTLSFESTSMDLCIGDTKQIVATPSEVLPEQTFVVYESSDPSIASVDELGHVVAVAVGEVKITATYLDATATCDVTVGISDAAETYYPNVVLDEYTLDAYNDLLVGQKFSVGAEIAFRNDRYEDATFSYEIADTSVLKKVEGNIFEPLKKGSTTIKITAEWRNVNATFIKTKEISVSVVANSYVFTVNNRSDFENYCLDLELGEEESFDIVAKENGEDIKDTVEISIVGDTEAVSLSNNAIKAEGIGEGYLDIRFTDSEGEVHNRQISFSVTVDLSGVEINRTFYLDGTTALNAEQIFNKTGLSIQKCVAADDTKAKFTVLNNVLTVANLGTVYDNNGCITDYGLLGKKIVALITASDGSTEFVYLMPVTKKINNEMEFITTFNNVDAVAGYYILTDNIKMTATDTYHTTAKYCKSALTNFENKGFKGTLDGLGHTVKGLRTNKTLLGIMHKNSAVKNIAFVDVKENSTFDSGFKYGFLTNYCAGELNNVYVSFAEDNDRYLALYNSSSSFEKLNNVVIDFTNNGVDTKKLTGAAMSYCGVFTGFMNQNVINSWNNLFVLSNLPLLVETDSAGNYKRIYDAYNVQLTKNDYISLMTPYGLISTTFANNPKKTTNNSILRFDQRNGMATYLKDKASSLDMAGFNSEYWSFDATTGALTWKTVNAL